jgi:hypothetical protein
MTTPLDHRRTLLTGALREPDGDGTPDAVLGARHEDDLPGAPLPVAHASATMGLRSVPIPLISNSMPTSTPHDITLQELRIESFFPADEATEEFSRA